MAFTTEACVTRSNSKECPGTWSWEWQGCQGIWFRQAESGEKVARSFPHCPLEAMVFLESVWPACPMASSLFSLLASWRGKYKIKSSSIKHDYYTTVTFDYLQSFSVFSFLAPIVSKKKIVCVCVYIYIPFILGFWECGSQISSINVTRGLVRNVNYLPA